jgi:hypothetical protein
VVHLEGIDVAELTWRRQSVWSQAANRAKADVERSRRAALGLMMSVAVLSTASVQVMSVSGLGGRVLASAATLAAALVPVAKRMGGSVSGWIRLRSVSETLKAEVYVYLAGAEPYQGADRQALLLERTEEILRDASDLGGHTTGIDPVPRELPPVTDADSYFTVRVVNQIDRYYRPQARRMQAMVGRMRRAELSLSVLSACLAATTTIFTVEETSAWVGVITTITVALVAHAAAARYEYQQLEYTRTADELGRLLERRAVLSASGSDDHATIQRCEHIISIQTEGWMAKWSVHTESIG